MISHLRFAVRSLARSPGFTLVALLTLAFGIGVNTAMFSMLNGFLLRPLAYPQVEQLFRLDRVTPQRPHGDHSTGNVIDLMRESTGFAQLAAFRYWAFTLSEPNEPADVPLALRVSANYFDVLGLKPEHGRNFVPDEDVEGRNNVIIISHRYWQTRFGGAANIVGRTVRIDGAPAQIVGVLPERDDAPRLIGPVAIYRPIAFSRAERVDRASNDVAIVGRYRDGVTPPQAEARFTALASRLAADHPAENALLELRARSLQSTALQGVGRTMTFLLIGLSGFVLLIACANLANLLLARAISRAREFSIRAALGAARGQLIKPLAVECLVLAIGGGLTAIVVAVWTSAWLEQRFGGGGTTPDFSLDGRVLTFTFAMSVLTALLFGIAPAWWAARVDVNDSLKGGARGSTGNRAQARYRQLLLVAQFALALILLSGAGFFVKGVAKLVRVDSGWKPDTLITGVVNLASAKYNSAEPILAFHRELRDRLLAVPGVANVAVSYEEPLYDAPAQRNYRVEGRPPPTPGHEIVAYTNGVSASYFDTVGTRLLRGRVFDSTDTITSRPVVVINDTMARALFPGEDAIGHRLAVVDQNSPTMWAEIVGIVEDIHAQRVEKSLVPFQLYKPYPQEAWQYVTVSVRAADPAKVPSLLEPIRRAVASLDPEQPIFRLMPATARMAANVAMWKTIDQLLIIFAILGLLLAALGIYGVTARLVAQRTPEFGIRLALGATGRDMARLVLGHGGRLVALGLAFGIGGCLVLSRIVARLLNGLGAADPLTLCAACAVLAVIALLACWLPARRAARVDPLVALRVE